MKEFKHWRDPAKCPKGPTHKFKLRPGGYGDSCDECSLTIDEYGVFRYLSDGKGAEEDK